MHASLSAGRNDGLVSQSMYQIIYSMLRSEYESGGNLNQTLAEVEERLIRNALREADSLAGAARLLGITKQNLHYKLQKYKIK